ncbi:MAG: AAA family ATPase [Acidobacteria bacterium]|jgi:predicted ATP-dependent endonuclease of OLD family|nr:AAA family ATPase [Acidobacteriota bacterium]MBA4121817.1 AAA family ATPase [Acidobacteriota bacterium]
MRLNRVTIENFRSISNVTIKFEPRCRVLVGINESGKSNILKALSLLDTEKTIGDEDLRESSTDEDIIEEGEISFIFTLDDEDRTRAYEILKKKVLGDLDANPIIEIDKKKLTLLQYFSYKIETLYRILFIVKAVRGAIGYKRIFQF